MDKRQRLISNASFAIFVISWIALGRSALIRETNPWAAAGFFLMGASIGVGFLSRKLS